jgi:hypothetical protein
MNLQTQDNNFILQSQKVKDFSPIDISGCIGYWNFNEPSGQTAFKNLVTGSYDGTILVPATVTMSPDGKNGNCLKFVESTNRPAKIDNSIVNTQLFNSIKEFAWSFWFRTDNIDTTAGTDNLIWKYLDGSAGYGGNFVMQIRRTAAGYGRLQVELNEVNEPGAFGRLTIGAGSPQPIWEHGIVNIDDLNNKFYVYKNGSFVGSRDYGTRNWPVINHFLYLGGLTPASEGVKGSLDDFAIYNRMLTLEEIKKIYDSNNREQRLTIKTDMNTYNLNSIANTKILNSNQNIEPILPTDISGCVFYMNMDEIINGSYIEEKVSGRLGSLIGSPLPEFTTGYKNNGLAFYGQSGLDNKIIYLTYGSPLPFDRNQSFSTSMWLNQGFITHTDASQPFVCYSYNAWHKSYSAGSINIQYNRSGLGDRGFVLQVPTGTWHHVVTVRDAETGSVFGYVDGKYQVGNNTVGSLTVNPTHSIMIGAHSAYPQHQYLAYSGLIDDVSIFNKTLNKTEIYNLYRMHKPKYLNIKEVGN